jgi:hypothetical protein
LTTCGSIVRRQAEIMRETGVLVDAPMVTET